MGDRARVPNVVTVTTTAAPATPTLRLHGLDALRAGALGLGIVLHTLIPFAPGAEAGWMLADAQSSEAVIPVMVWIHLFRMVLFMMLAGYFGRMVLHRRGAGAYLRDRAKRILLPLLTFTPLIAASLWGVITLNLSVRDLPATMTVAKAEQPLWQVLLTPAHLWFLNVLMQCVLITVILRAVLLRFVGQERLDALADRVGGLLAAPLGVLLAAVPYVLSLLVQGTVSNGIAEPATLLPTLSTVVGYLGAFLVGWCLHARRDALPTLARTWPLHLAAALVLTVCGYLVEEGSIPLVLHAAIVAVSGWTWAFGLTGLCVRFLRDENRTVRYLADSSYWVYLLHLPVLAVIQVFLADLSWPVPVKLLVTWGAGMPLLLLSYDLLVRGSGLGQWLNGHRRTPALLPAPRRPRPTRQPR